MIGKQRTTAPILVLALLTLALFGRQAWVQVREHDLWAEQAARLSRSGELIPYKRGAITDAWGRALVRDIEAYHLEVSYRAFRREHPLGQATHGASVLLLEPVPLTLGLAHAPAWARELVGLTPGQLRDLARGRGLVLSRSLPGLPSTRDASGSPRRLGYAADEAERRRLDLGNRAGDLGFYIGGLLDLDRDEKKALLRAADDEDRRDRSYLALVADLRGVTPQGLDAWLADRVRDGLADLDLLAARMDYGDAVGDRPASPLVDELEDWRRGIEDAAARRLFREAAAFDPGRLAPELLYDHVDLTWFAVHLRWDAERTRAWCEAVRRGWRDGWRAQRILPSMVAELLGGAGERTEDATEVVAMLSSLWYGAGDLDAALDGAPRALAERGDPEVFGALARMLDGDLAGPPAPDDPRLPWASHARALDGDGPVPLEDLADALGDGAPGSSAYRKAVEERLALAVAEGTPTSRAERWVFHLSRPDYRSRDILLELAGELCDAWEVGVQALFAERLEAARGDGPRLALRPEALDRAADRARFVLRDYGLRRSLLDDEPSYEVVQLLTRYPDRFPGFRARAARERIHRAGPGGDRPAELLVGRTSMLSAEGAQAQRADARRLRELRRMGRRSPAEDDELVALIARVLTTEEERGVSGVEGAWDEVLRGYNGYRERVGLADVEERGGIREVDLRLVQHGRDLALTLDTALNRVAEEVLEHPVVPDREEAPDPAWLADPEGAIVVLRPNGDLVVAASGPAPWSPRVSPDRPALERCFTKLDFTPPGSTFKPFTALAALELGKVTATEAFLCLSDPDDASSDRGVHGGVHCHKIWGHSAPAGVGPPLGLTEALRVSCNVYFAHLGERLSQTEFHRFARHFGFGEPTGVVPDEATGFAEDTADYIFERGDRPIRRRNLMRGANGLSVVEATPVQLARAFAGLATGELPTVRLVDAIEDERGLLAPVPRPAPVPVPYDPAHLALVREALVEVAAHPDGSAHKALSPAEIGMDLAVKTGSADLRWLDETTLLKHTWVAGWAPAEDPQVVVVVLVRHTVKTSGRTSIWLARQFLLQPEVRAFLAEEGVPLVDVEVDPRELGR